MLDVSKNSAFRRAVITVPALPGNVSRGVVAVLLKALLGLGYSVSKFFSIVCFHGCPSHSDLNKIQENSGTDGTFSKLFEGLEIFRMGETSRLSLVSPVSVPSFQFPELKLTFCREMPC